MTTAKDFIQESTQREMLERLSDGGLLRRAAREAAIAVYVVAQCDHAPNEARTDQACRGRLLMRALAECFRAATVALGQARNMAAMEPDAADAERLHQ
jgi:hypothetical protein